jgi:ribosomal protein S18 acetylase RimI-like enzyme
MADQELTTGFVIRRADIDDIPAIEALDRFSTSSFREIHHDLEKYFGSLDPSQHERNLIFLALVETTLVGKAELVLAPASVASLVGYIKRVVVHPDYRGHGIARRLMQAVIAFSHEEHLSFLDLHVFEQNLPAIRLYESLGFEEEHREVYYRLRLKGEQSHEEF